MIDELTLLEPCDLTPAFADDDPDTPIWWQTVADLCDEIVLLLAEVAPPPTEDRELPADDRDDAAREGR